MSESVSSLGYVQKSASYRHVDAGSVSVSADLKADSLAVTNEIDAKTLVVSQAITGNSLAITNEIDAKTLVVSQAISGNSLAITAGITAATARYTGQEILSAYVGASTLSTGVASTVTYASNTHTGAWNVAGDGKITVPSTGVYLVIAAVDFAANATGYRSVLIYANSDSVPTAWTSGPPGAAIPILQVSGLLALAANDIIRVAAIQTSGGNLAIGVAFVASVQILRVA